MFDGCYEAVTGKKSPAVGRRGFDILTKKGSYCRTNKRLRRSRKARPNKPIPNSVNEAGSGTALVLYNCDSDEMLACPVAPESVTRMSLLAETSVTPPKVAESVN